MHLEGFNSDKTCMCTFFGELRLKLGKLSKLFGLLQPLMQINAMNDHCINFDQCSLYKLYCLFRTLGCNARME